MVASLLDTKMMERKIFLGVKAFELFQHHLGILYGNSFEINGVKFIRHPLLSANWLVTADPQLKVALKQFQDELKVGATLNATEGLLAEIKAKGVL